MNLNATFLSRYLFVLSILFSCQKVFCQKEANTWYFGDHAGIDFNSGSAVALMNSGMYEFEGGSTISDPITGSVLFYTNGEKVWNANNTVTANGTGLTGDASSAQAALIVPDPGNADQYYIFTAGEYYSNGNDGYRYSIVDMSLNGGLGDVTSTKNILLYSPACEKLAAIKNSTGDGYWIATHEWNGNNFDVYELTASGLSSPVISSVGTSYGGDNPIGCMKFSPAGNRLATVLSGLNEADIFDFDPATGILSNSFTVGPIGATNPYVYGISFSPDGSKLYVTEENDNHIYQYDLNAGTVSEINASKTAVGTTSSYAMQATQLAPDGKLYIERNGASYLAVINDPDSLGTLCNFVDDGFYPGGQTVTYGLPGFVESIIFPDTLSNPVAFAASDTRVCQKYCISFSDLSTNNPTSWSWTFEGGSPPTSSDQNPTQICYNLPGTYDVTLVACNGTDCDSITLTDFIHVIPTPPAPTITHNGDTLISSEALSYQWQYNGVDLPGETNQWYVMDQPEGQFTVYVSDSNGCVNYASIDITGIEDPLLNGINIFPNPSTGNFMVSGSGFQSSFLQIEVTNAIGQRIYSSKEENTGPEFKKEISLGNISAGVYFLELKTENFSAKRKLEVN